MSPLPFNSCPSIVEQIFTDSDYPTQLTLRLTCSYVCDFVDRHLGRHDLAIVGPCDYPTLHCGGNNLRMPIFRRYGEGTVPPPRYWESKTLFLSHVDPPSRFTTELLPHVRPDCQVLLDHSKATYSGEAVPPPFYQIPKVASLSVTVSAGCDCDEHYELNPTPELSAFKHGAERVTILFKEPDDAATHEWITQDEGIPLCHLLCNLVGPSVQHLTFDCQSTCLISFGLAMRNILEGFRDREESPNPALKVTVRLHSADMGRYRNTMCDVIVTTFDVQEKAIIFEVVRPDTEGTGEDDDGKSISPVTP